MTNATIIIGAGFGDEGKGHMVDYVCAQNPGSIVVRHNGGAQAGHTVDTGEHRHVFHHFGSGTLAGAATYLSQFFVVNPHLWRKERDELGLQELIPPVYVSPIARLTTPWDVMLNQEIERKQCHGSCGIGFGETIQRHEQGPGTLVGGIRSKYWVERILEVREDYVPRRLEELGIKPSEAFRELQMSKVVLDKFLYDCDAFRRGVTMKLASDLNPRHWVFEGAQGLLLDQESEFFPHVTRSRTGMHNALAIAKDIGGIEPEAIYVTRWYLTRHGEGPLPGWGIDPGFQNIQDDTNTPNEWQGKIRYAPMDRELLTRAVGKDRQGTSAVPAALAVTCLDHAGDPDEALDRIPKILSVSHVSTGPTRADVVAAMDGATT